MNLREYASFDGLGLASLVKTKEITPNELIHLALEGISKVNPKINAIVKTLPIETEKEIHQSLVGAFAGVPFLLKEYPVHAAGIPVRLGSRLTQNGITSPHDSSLMTRFRKSGLLAIGTTTVPEFALDASTESVLYGSTHNPWDLGRTPGGSSGGAAAAVSSGIVPIAHGNDFAGSIRTPAACCHLVGLKPTRGRVPSGPDFGETLFGLAAEFAITKSVRDVAALLDAVSGPDIGCYSWAEPPKKPYVESISSRGFPLNIAVMSKPLNGANVDPEITAALKNTVRLCEELGHNVFEATVDIDEEMHFNATINMWTASLYKEIKDLAKDLLEHPSERNLESVVLSAFHYGKNVKAEELLDALDVQNTISRKVGNFFTSCDVLLTPTNAQLPLKLGNINLNKQKWDVREWLEHSNTFTAFQDICNTTGLPAISLPLGMSKSGLPIGMQFIGRFADETTLLQLARHLERAHPWEHQQPPIHVSNE